MENYRFVKPYEMDGGTIAEGTTLAVVNGVVYYENGIVMDMFQGAFLNLIAKEKKTGWNYLRPYRPIYNKV